MRLFGHVVRKEELENQVTLQWHHYTHKRCSTKWPPPPSPRTISVALDMSKAFDTINIHTLIRKLLQTNITATILKFIAKSTQHTETTHPYKVNLKLAFPKLAYSHPHHLTFTQQNYHHPEHRFSSWHTLPSHLHTQARMQQRNTYNHTYITCLPGQNNNLTLNPDKTICIVSTPDTAEHKSKNKQHCTTYCNAPNNSGSYLRHTP